MQEATIEDEPIAEHRATAATALAASLAAASLAACGGGSSSGSDDGGGGTAPPPAVPTDAEASRFLAQASMGGNRTHIARIVSIGYAGWLDEQLALPASTSRWDALVAAGLDDIAYKNGEAGFDGVAWKKLLASPDTLRQRMTLALSEILVVSIDSLVGGGWKAFAAAHYLDLLEADAFGSFRTLLQDVTLSSAMGMYLTYRGSAKANATTGALPDENYARELMQLFTLGLVQLNADGTPALAGGATTATYGQDDITGLARVFTGWDFDLAGLGGGAGTATPEFQRRPMVQVASRYESGSKVFLGTTIPAGTDATTGLTLALDALFAHANVGPFVCRQLIQHLVTSNPSPGYVGRIAAVFANDGTGARGNLKAVLRALLLDSEARSASVAAGTSAGKLREPMLRFSGWARAWNASSPGDTWNVGNTSDPATRLGQSPLRSPSVFNFFRPGYVPPNTAIASAGLVAPEFQLANESSIVGAVNYLQRAVAGQGVGDLAADYGSLLAFGDDAASMVAEIDIVLCAGQLGAATVTTLATAVATIAGGSDANRLKRIYAALTLAMAAPSFAVLK